MNSILITEQLPLFETVFGEAAEPCESDGNTTVSIRGTKKTEFRAYTDALMKAGAALHAKNEIAGNLFETYVLVTVEGEALTVHLVYYPVRGNTRIVYGKKGFLPEQSDAVFASGNGRTSILQYARNGVYNSQPATGAPGMSYLITLADGSFLIIDGGPRQREQHFTAEIPFAKKYDYIVFNHDGKAEETANSIFSIVNAEKLAAHRIPDIEKLYFGD